MDVFNSMRALLGIILMLFVLGDTWAAELPTKVDYTATVVAAKRAVDAGHQGQTELFIQSTEGALKHAKEQSKIRTTAASQRITEHLWAALQKAQAGQLQEATALVEEEIADMK